MKFMIRLLIVLILIILIFIIFRNKRKNLYTKSDIYKKIILILIIAGILFFLATSGRFILPQILQIFKMILPLLTKFIGI